MSDAIKNKAFDATQKVAAIQEHFIDRYLKDTSARIEDCELCQQTLDGVIRIWIKRRDVLLPTLGTNISLPPTDLYINKLEPGEPHFLLMGRDPLAPILVREWALKESYIDGNSEKVRPALAVADAMEVWRSAKENPIAE